MALKSIWETYCFDFYLLAHSKRLNSYIKYFFENTQYSHFPRKIFTLVINNPLIFLVLLLLFSCPLSSHIWDISGPTLVIEWLTNWQTDWQNKNFDFERSLRLVRHDLTNQNTITKTKTIPFRKHPQRAILETCDL